MGGFISRAVSIVSNAVMVVAFVLRMPCFCRFMFPLSVAGEKSGSYFWTAFVVKPGHVANWLLCNALGRVALGGLKPAWWRYLMRLALEVIAYALCA